MPSTPRVFDVLGDVPDAAAITAAATILRGGGLVGFPTETVYGLGADATNPTALARLTRVKQRPPEKPYSLHLHTPAQLRPFLTSVPASAAALIERFWPGPLTLVVLAKDGTKVGFRLPDHAIARAFLQACDVPVAAPSANRSGAAPPTAAHEVLQALDGELDCLLDGGPTRHGQASTVVEVTNGRVVVLREGAIPKEAIDAAVGA